MSLIPLNADTTGLLLISGLDSENQALQKEYGQIVRSYQQSGNVPSSLLNRHGAVPADHSVVKELITQLKEAKSSGLTVSETQKSLKQLKETILSQKILQKDMNICGPLRKPTNIITKHDALSFIHCTLRPNRYLEIGVNQGKSLSLAQCEAIGIDPVPQKHAPLTEKIKLITATSDEFFISMANKLLANPPDLVLIDGMPLIEYVLQDFINSERYSNHSTLLVVANIYPRYTEQATRHRHGPEWVGDVWKLPGLLSAYRPDLFMLPISVADYGLLLVAGLDPKNNTLQDKMVEICKEQIGKGSPLADGIAKKNAVPGSHPAVETLMITLRQIREQSLPSAELANQLKIITI